MVSSGNFVDVDLLMGKTYEVVIEDVTPESGVLVTEGTEAAKLILEAFPAGGYTLRDAYELRDLILKFNSERHLTPTTL